MPTWTVTLQGDPWDLETLTRLGLGVTQEGHAFVLRSTELDGLTDPGTVRQRAIEIVEALDGVARIAVGDYDAVEVGAVAGEDGSATRSIFVREEIQPRERLRVELTDATTGKRIGPTPRADYAKWAAVALQDPSVRQALRLMGDPPTPATLYKVFEIIRADVGGQVALLNTGWATRSQVARFTHSMNSPAALGDTARHGVEPSPQLPSDPMGLPEADSLVRRLLEKWLTTK